MNAAKSAGICTLLLLVSDRADGYDAYPGNEGVCASEARAGASESEARPVGHWGRGRVGGARRGCGRVRVP